MKNKYFKPIDSIAVLLLIFLFLATGCNSGNKSHENEDIKTDENVFSPFVVEDQMGRKITINKVPEKIISLAPSNTEILFALGLGDKVIGVTNYCDYPEEVKNKNKVGDYSEPNMEQIIALEPDLVLATSFHEQPVKQLDKLHIPTLVIEPKNMDEMLESINIIGWACNEEKAAGQLINSLKQRIDAVVSKTRQIPENERPKVYYELFPSPMITAGPGTFINDLIYMAGGINIADDAQSAYPEYSQEMIIAKNPDIILYSHHGTAKESEQQIINRQGWENIKAIQRGKIYYIDGNIIQRTAPRLIDALEQIAKIVHPELF